MKNINAIMELENIGEIVNLFVRLPRKVTLVVTTYEYFNVNFYQIKRAAFKKLARIYRKIKAGDKHGFSPDFIGPVTLTDYKNALKEASCANNLS